MPSPQTGARTPNARLVNGRTEAVDDRHDHLDGHEPEQRLADLGRRALLQEEQRRQLDRLGPAPLDRNDESPREREAATDEEGARDEGRGRLSRRAQERGRSHRGDGEDGGTDQVGLDQADAGQLGIRRFGHGA